MCESRFLKRGYWPVTEMPEDVIAYYTLSKLPTKPSLLMYIDTYQDLLEALNRRVFFQDYWEYLCDNDAEKAKYFASIMKEETPPAEFRKIEMEYYKDQCGDIFNDLTEDRRRKVQADFEAWTPDSYHDVLKGEALRLKCDVSEVRPPCPVIPFTTEGNESSRLVDLPDGIFLKIVNRLDTLDVFRITLVCKRWKNVICDNPRSLRRAEHAKTTHLITFTDWMETEKNQRKIGFERNYLTFSLGLIKWCCQVNEHLETLILHSELSSSTLQTLLESCPNLRNLQIGYGSDFSLIECDETICEKVHLTNLEFYSSWLYDCDHMSQLNKKILVSCESLRFFEGHIELPQIPEVDIQNRLQYAFENLIALDLTLYNVHVLDILADIDDLKLRYFRLGHREGSKLEDGGFGERFRVRNLLDRILGKLKKLEVLIVIDEPGISNSSIKQLTQMKVNLKLAAFTECSIIGSENESDGWTSEVLSKFGEMLLSNNQELDLSEFCLVAKEDKIPQDLKNMNVGFTFLGAADIHEMEHYDRALNELSITCGLGINF